MLERKRERHVSCVVKVKTENLCRTVWAKQSLYFRFKVKKWLTAVITFLVGLFCFGKCKNLGWSEDAKQRKKGGIGWTYKTTPPPNNQLITKNATSPYTLLSCGTRRVFLTRYWKLEVSDDTILLKIEKKMGCSVTDRLIDIWQVFHDNYLLIIINDV